MKIKWTPKSESDLDQLHKILSENFEKLKADEVIVNLIESTEFILSKNPLAGKILETNPLFSFLVIEGNKIFYTENPKEKTLYIIYVQARKSNLKNERLKL